ncbi:MAG: hypothetical protein AAGA09_06140 [Pseudomonadota bacterium]
MRLKAKILVLSAGAASLSLAIAALAQEGPATQSGPEIAPQTTTGAPLAAPTAVETTTLAQDAFSTGTLSAANGALPRDLWRGADTETLEYLLLHAPARPTTPAIGEALRRVLLSPGAAPEAAAPSLGGKKLLALSRAGFVEEANTVASLSNGGRGDPWTGQALAISDLLKDDVARACQRNANLSSGRDELFWVKLRVLCYAEAGERDAADLTFNILREQGSLSASEETLLSSLASGGAPKTPVATGSILEYVVARRLKLPMAPGLLENAEGGVLVAVARDAGANLATRLGAAREAVAMGVMEARELTSLMDSASFDVAEIGDAVTAALARPVDPMTDALLYQSVKAMAAPEFLRDKAQRISLALGLADRFPRAYALSLLYADEIASLEGAIVSAEEAERFAVARMAVGDAVGAGQWLLAMIGESGSLSALPQPQAMAFIDRVNLLAALDPQTAAQIARTAGVSLIAAESAVYDDRAGRANPARTAAILKAAFDAAVDAISGQAALAALAAAGPGDANDGAGESGVGEINDVVVEQGLKIAGMSELLRRNKFERAWSSSFGAADIAQTGDVRVEQDGFTPRLKPSRG